MTVTRSLENCIGAASPSGGSAPVIEELNVTPSTSAQEITAPEGVDGFSPVKVSAVTASIDANIVAGNIKKDVQILGVTGTFEGGGKYKLFDRVKDDSNNEIGTVSGFFTDANNVEYAVVCLDAQYRLASVYWCSYKESVVTNLPVYDSTTWGPWEAKETATFNTQKILDYCTANNYTSTACSHCRSKSFTIDGQTYYGQLPNMVELNDIVRNHTALNTADTTASSYTSVNFASGRNAWSSSQYNSGTAWLTAFYGGFANNDKTDSFVVVPVLELPNS